MALHGAQQRSPAIEHFRSETEGLRPVGNVAESVLSLLVHLAHRSGRVGRRYRTKECHMNLLSLRIPVNSSSNLAQYSAARVESRRHERLSSPVIVTRQFRPGARDGTCLAAGKTEPLTAFGITRGPRSDSGSPRPLE